MSAGLKVLGFFAGPPIAVSLNDSAPIEMLGTSHEVIFLGKMSNGGEKVEDLNVCSPLNSFKAGMTASGINVSWNGAIIAMRGAQRSPLCETSNSSIFSYQIRTNDPMLVIIFKASATSEPSFLARSPTA